MKCLQQLGSRAPKCVKSSSIHEKFQLLSNFHEFPVPGWVQLLAILPCDRPGLDRAWTWHPAINVQYIETHKVMHVVGQDDPDPWMDNNTVPYLWKNNIILILYIYIHMYINIYIYICIYYPQTRPDIDIDIHWDISGWCQIQNSTRSWLLALGGLQRFPALAEDVGGLDPSGSHWVPMDFNGF